MTERRLGAILRGCDDDDESCDVAVGAAGHGCLDGLDRHQGRHHRRDGRRGHRHQVSLQDAVHQDHDGDRRKDVRVHHHDHHGREVEELACQKAIAVPEEAGLAYLTVTLAEQREGPEAHLLERRELLPLERRELLLGLLQRAEPLDGAEQLVQVPMAHLRPEQQACSAHCYHLRSRPALAVLQEPQGRLELGPQGRPALQLLAPGTLERQEPVGPQQEARLAPLVLGPGSPVLALERQEPVQARLVADRRQAAVAYGVVASWSK